MAPVKILVCGNIDGKFNQVFNRIATVNKKNGPFEFLLCCGNFFGDGENSEWAAYREGRRRVPLQTYVLGSAGRLPRHLHPDSEADELCLDVMALGERGVFTSSGGVSLAYAAADEPSAEDVRALEQALLASSAAGVDLLLTPGWPRGLTRRAAAPPGVYSEETGSPRTARLLYCLRPRYVFSGGQALHYERLPYRNHQVLRDQQAHVTRFIALAPAFNADKAKWLYAFGLEPMARMARAELVAQPPDVTECPFSAEEMAAAAAGGDETAKQYFYATDGRGEPAAKRRRHQQREPRADRPPAANCWFCLASPEVEKHLVVNVGDSCYLALAKGGLVPDHLLILPVEHVRASTEADDAVWQEVSAYKRRLQKLFAAEDKAVVFFERNYKQSHLQVQCVPVPARLVPALKEAVQDHCDSEGVSLEEVPPLSDVRQLAPPGAPYLYVELPGGVKLFHNVTGKLPLSIGRSMLACPPLLNMPERVEWSECVISKEEQTARAKEFKVRFKKFS